MALQVWLPLRGDLRNLGLDKDYDIPSTNHAVWASEGKIGNKALYPTTTTSGVLTYSKTLSNAHSYTICAWVKTTELLNSSRYIIWTGSDSNYVGFGFKCSNSGNSIDGMVFGTSITLNTGLDQWHHIAMIVDYENLQFSAYLDGIFVQSKTYTQRIVADYGVNIGWLRPSYYPYKGYINDVRIYDYCLSSKEVKEISKGLVLHYKLNSLSLSTTNLIVGFVQGGQTTISGNNININGSNADTYFYINTSKALTLGKQYKLSCIGEGFADNSYYNFPVGKQNNYSQGTLVVKNGYCELIFIANDVIVNVGTKIILDDNGRQPSAGTITKMILQEYTNNVFDYSGYQNDADVIGNLILANNTSRYNRSIQFDGNSYINRTPLDSSSEIKTISFWANWNSVDFSSNYASQCVLFVDHGTKTGFGLLSSKQVLLTTTAAGDSYTYPNQNFVANIWYHFVIVITGTTTRDLYINGIRKIPTTNTNQWTYSTNQLQIGRRSTTSDGFNGKISDFRMYTTILSEEDIKELYNTSAIVDNLGNIYGYQFEESGEGNLLFNQNLGIINKQWVSGLSKFTQANCQCTLTDDGYRIYRTPNIDYVNNSPKVMYGGFLISNANNILNLKDNHSYVLAFDIKGQSSNAASNTRWTNNYGWGGGGLIPTTTGTVMNNPVTANFYSPDDWCHFSMFFTISDGLYKVCTTSYSSYIQGETYLSYAQFAFGFTYMSTGELGTDLYIKNLSLLDVTNDTNINISKNGIINSENFIEVGDTVKLFKDKLIQSNQLIEI